MIGQWRSTLIVMNGDDYEHRRKTNRITVTSSAESPRTQFVTLTTGSEGTRIYIDGRLAAAKRNMRLELPKGKNVRLVAGNSAYGTHPWEGELYGVAIFGKALSDSDVAIHYAGWSENMDFTFADPLSPVILYNLDKNGTNQAPQVIDDPLGLQVPPRMKPLLPSFLFQQWNFKKIGKSIFNNRDAFLNLFGFIPLGLLLGGTLIKLGGKFKTHCVSISLAAGFLVSLCIETLQAWMPARSSDMQDLFLNTAGAFVGALFCKYALLKGRGTETEPMDEGRPLR
jgi:VanZ family protein